MRKPILLFAVWAVGTLSSTSEAAMPSGTLSSPAFRTVLSASPTVDDPSEIARQRQEIIDAILTSDEPEFVARQRWVCFTGEEPARVREARAGGFAFTPDAFDSCVASLRRKGKDRALIEAYRKLAVSLGGNPDTCEKLPQALGAAVLSGNGTASIGNGKGVKVDAALAFDAGFTVAYMSGAAKKEGLDQQKLRLIAESCLDQQQNAATCFSVGYIFGARAVNPQ